MLKTYYFKKNLLFSLKTYYFTDELTILHCNAHLLIVTILELYRSLFRSLYNIRYVSKSILKSRPPSPGHFPDKQALLRCQATLRPLRLAKDERNPQIGAGANFYSLHRPSRHCPKRSLAQLTERKIAKQLNYGKLFLYRCHRYVTKFNGYSVFSPCTLYA